MKATKQELRKLTRKHNDQSMKQYLETASERFEKLVKEVEKLKKQVQGHEVMLRKLRVKKIEEEYEIRNSSNSQL